MPSVIEPPSLALASPCANKLYIAAPRGSATPITMSFFFSLQIARDAGERAAGADGADEAVDLAAGLVPRSPAPVET